MKKLFIIIPAIILLFGCTKSFDDGNALYDKKEYKEAFEVLKPLADKGDAKSQNLVGLMLSNGNGVSKNNQEAVKYFQLAAAQGLVSAQDNLGTAYEYGVGVVQSNSEALTWYEKAAKQGDPESQNKFDSLKRRMINLGQLEADQTISPSEQSQPPNTSSPTNPPELTYAQLVQHGAALGEDNWAKCAAANLTLAALSVQWKEMPSEMLKANTVLGDLLGDIRKYYIRNGVSEQILSSLVKKWSSTSIGNNGDVAVQTVGDCISKMTKF